MGRARRVRSEVGSSKRIIQYNEYRYVSSILERDRYYGSTFTVFYCLGVLYKITYCFKVLYNYVTVSHSNFILYPAQE